MATIRDVIGVLNRLAGHVTDTRKLREGYARDVLRQARRNAAGQPTPQARMTAEGMRQRRGAVLGFPSTRVGDDAQRMGGFSFGSEFGSNQYRQFAPRNERGYWLTPALEQVGDGAADTWLDDVFDAALRGVR